MKYGELAIELLESVRTDEDVYMFMESFTSDYLKSRMKAIYELYRGRGMCPVDAIIDALQAYRIPKELTHEPNTD